MLRTKVAATLAVVALAVSVAGCTTSAPDPQVATRSLTTFMLDRAQNAEQASVETSLSDLLPTHRFSIQGRKAAALADGIIVGRITKVEAGAAYTVNPNDDTVSVRIPFDSPDALWRDVVITVTTDTRLGSTTAKSVRVGFVIDSSMDLQLATAGLEGLGRVVLVLNEPGFFEFDPSLYSVRQSGALLGTVDTAGTIAFPALGDDSAEFVGDTDTVSDLVTDAAKPAPVVDVEVSHNDFVRSDDDQ